MMTGIKKPISAPRDVQIAQLTAAMRLGFGAEMALVFDYLRGKTPDDIAADEAMQLAMKTFRDDVAAITGPADAETTLARILGQLLLDYLSGQPAKPSRS